MLTGDSVKVENESEEEIESEEESDLVDPN
jgi:hypothetical protein